MALLRGGPSERKTISVFRNWANQGGGILSRREERGPANILPGKWRSLHGAVLPKQCRSERVGIRYPWVRYLLPDIDLPEHLSILREVPQLSFPYLREISLPSNQFESVEILTRVHMPLLEFLYMRTFLDDEGENRISRIKELRKVSPARLAILSVGSDCHRQVIIRSGMRRA